PIQLRYRHRRAAALDRQRRQLHGDPAGAHDRTRRHDPDAAMGLIWATASLVRGFAEATLFFVVPDVLLTVAAVRIGLRRTLPLSLVAARGAVSGGMVMWHWGAPEAEAARNALLQVPAVGVDQLERVGTELSQDWAVNLALGPLSGTPYKIYAT